MLRVRVEAIKGHRMALRVGLVAESTAIIAMEAKTGKKRSSENKGKGSLENKEKGHQKTKEEHVTWKQQR